MKKKLTQILLIISVLVTVIPIAIAASPPEQDGPEDYIVSSDDWMSKLSEKYLGSVLAYSAITNYTNERAIENISDGYAIITDSNIIDVGAQLYIPSQDEAETFFNSLSTLTDDGGDEVIGLLTSLESLDPLTNTNDVNAAFALEQLSDPLIELDDSGTPTPALAESWEFSPDGSRLIVKLREGVTYHDGTTQFNASHLESYWNVLASKQGGDNCLQIQPIVGNDYMIEILLNGVDPQDVFPLISQTPIFHPDSVADGNGPLIGTGPWQIDYSSPTPSVLIDNPAYWNTEVSLPSVNFQLTDDFASLDPGQVTTAIDLNLQDNFGNGITLHLPEELKLLGFEDDCASCQRPITGPGNGPCTPPVTPTPEPSTPPGSLPGEPTPTPTPRP